MGQLSQICNTGLVVLCPITFILITKFNVIFLLICYAFLLLTYIFQGWPKLVLQVSCLDSFTRSWIVGYSCCSLPAVPGHHSIKVSCWVPQATNLTDRIRQYFLGGSHQLLQSDLINLGLDR